MKKLLNRKNFYWLGALFVLLLFAYTTYNTPLAGDDWGYALNGMSGDPIAKVIEFYQTWSGRIFSELWGFVVAPRKWLWNILNPLIFVLVFIGAYKLSGVSKRPVLSVFLILAMMLSVDDNLRMETYSWIMGTTYVIPLSFSLIAFYSMDLLFKEGVNKKTKIFALLCNVLLFIGGLMMENISACMVGGIVILLIYAYFNKKEIIRYLVINLVFALSAFAIMRLSPGSAARLAENTDWLAMSFFERLAAGYPNFLEMTFINNNYMIAFFSMSICLMLFSGKKKYAFVSVPVNMLAVFAVFSFVLIKENDPFINGSSLFSMAFWPVYVINQFISLYVGIEDKQKRDKAIFLLVIGGANALAMLFSPIYGSRSAIYTVYYVIVLSTLILDEIKVPKFLPIALCALCLIVVADRTHEYLVKYRQVAQVQAERLEILQYYREHPEDEEAWIPRFPVYTIHSGDIEEGDTYHFETFKEYYGLPQSADKIVFFYKDSYD